MSADYLRSTPINGHHLTGPAGPFRANERRHSAIPPDRDYTDWNGSHYLIAPRTDRLLRDSIPTF